MAHAAAWRAAARWIWAHAPQLAAGIAAATPVIRSTVNAVHAGWVPAGDDGIIATRGWDVLSSHTPLVGQYSEAGLVIQGQVMHSPGPMLYWLIALPARLGSVSSIAVTMGVVGTLAIVGCVALARRRGGLVLMFATAIGIALMCQSLPSEAMHDIWNPAAGLLPFLALIFLSWSLACGDYRLLPITALIACYVVQTHLMYVAPTVVLLVVGCGGLLIGWSARRRRSRSAPELSTATSSMAAPSATSPMSTVTPPTSTATPPTNTTTPPTNTTTSLTSTTTSSMTRRPRIWPWALAALLITAACWTPPAIDQIDNNPGNLAMIVRTAEHRGPTLGASVGWHAVVRSVGVRPWWLFVPASEWQRKAEVRATPGTTQTDSTIAILAALALVGLIAAVARRWDVTAASAIGLGLSAAIGLEAASNPAARLLAETLGYTMWWGSELGMWVWLILAWALWLGLVATARPALRAVRRWSHDRSGQSPAPIGSLALEPYAPTDAPAPTEAPALVGPPAPAESRALDGLSQPIGSPVPAPSAPVGSSALAPVGSSALVRSSAPIEARAPFGSPGVVKSLASALACIAGIGAVWMVGSAVARTEKPDSHVYEYAAIHEIAAAIERAVPPGQTVEYRFGPLDTGTQPMEPAIRFLLVRHGDRVLARGSYTRLGAYYEYYGQPVQWVIDVRDDPAEQQRSSRSRSPTPQPSATHPTSTARSQRHMKLVAQVRFTSPWGREIVGAWVDRTPR